ncbi:hypothetical protein Tco_1098639 [Tanacetum coccineum]
MSRNGFDRSEIIRVLAGHLITVAAMADGCLDLEHGDGSLDQIMVKHKSRLERENVVAADVDVPDNKTKNANSVKAKGSNKEVNGIMIDKEKKTVHMDHDNYDRHRHAVEIVEETPLHHWFKDSLEDNMEIQEFVKTVVAY